MTSPRSRRQGASVHVAGVVVPFKSALSVITSLASPLLPLVLEEREILPLQPALRVLLVLMRVLLMLMRVLLVLMRVLRVQDLATPTATAWTTGSWPAQALSTTDRSSFGSGWIKPSWVSLL
jgi:hypothetical protein